MNGLSWGILFVGLGNMGFPILRRLITQSHTYYSKHKQKDPEISPPYPSSSQQFSYSLPPPSIIISISTSQEKMESLRSFYQTINNANPSKFELYCFNSFSSLSSYLLSLSVPNYDPFAIVTCLPSSTEVNITWNHIVQNILTFHSALQSNTESSPFSLSLPSSSIRSYCDPPRLSSFPLLIIRLWLDFTSGNPLSSSHLSTLMIPHGILYSDCALSGGPKGSCDGTLSVLFSSPHPPTDSSFPQCPSPFFFLSQWIYHVVSLVSPHGKHVCSGHSVGISHAMKCLNNFLAIMNFIAFGEFTAAIEKNFNQNHNGKTNNQNHNPSSPVDVDSLISFVSSSSGSSTIVSSRYPNFVMKRNFTYGGKGSLALWHKDLKNAIGFLEETEKRMQSSSKSNESKMQREKEKMNHDNNIDSSSGNISCVLEMAKAMEKIFLKAKLNGHEMEKPFEYNLSDETEIIKVIERKYGTKMESKSNSNRNEQKDDGIMQSKL